MHGIVLPDPAGPLLVIVGSKRLVHRRWPDRGSRRTELTANHDGHAILYGERKFFRRNPDFAYVLAAKKATYLAWRAILEDGLRAGLFAADTDVYLTISTVIRMLTTGAGWFIHEDGSVLEVLGHYTLASLTEFYLTFILRSIRAPERAGLPVPAAIAE